VTGSSLNTNIDSKNHPSVRKSIYDRISLNCSCERFKMDDLYYVSRLTFSVFLSALRCRKFYLLIYSCRGIRNSGSPVLLIAATELFDRCWIVLGQQRHGRGGYGAVSL